MTPRTTTATEPLAGFRAVPRTGVIYVMTEAEKVGFHESRAEWANLGQGAPETSLLKGAPDRVCSLSFNEDDHEYAPVAGLRELREAVAELYNARYRKGKQSKYTYENVAICAGGRLALTRIVSTIGHSNLGHFLPDYTAYEELLDCFKTFVPIPILTQPEDGYRFGAEALEREILGRGLSAVLLSNPCNPTGRVLHGSELQGWVQVARELDCALILDEFYSHYVYGVDRLSVSAAEFVEDVNRDPVVLFDGLTKNWRYPGFRVSWTVAPAGVIEGLASAGSFIDGGCSRPMQLAALELVHAAVADREAAAIQNVFGNKRRMMIEVLEHCGIKINPEPTGGFYCWGDLSGLPPELNTGMRLFRRLLEEKVIIVPGVFFDINPGKRRPDRASRFGSFARFSFGPPEQEVMLGLERIKNVLG